MPEMVFGKTISLVTSGYRTCSSAWMKKFPYRSRVFEDVRGVIAIIAENLAVTEKVEVAKNQEQNQEPQEGKGCGPNAPPSHAETALLPTLSGKRN